MGHSITLLPQLIWLVAPVVYYLLVLRLAPGTSVAPSTSGMS